MVVYTWWRWSLRGREEFGFSVFEKIEFIFSIASEESFGEVARVFLAEKYSSDVGSDNVGR